MPNRPQTPAQHALAAIDFAVADSASPVPVTRSAYHPITRSPGWCLAQLWRGRFERTAAFARYRRSLPLLVRRHADTHRRGSPQTLPGAHAGPSAPPQPGQSLTSTHLVPKAAGLGGSIGRLNGVCEGLIGPLGSRPTTGHSASRHTQPGLSPKLKSHHQLALVPQPHGERT